jgi:hypothetical protein
VVIRQWIVDQEHEVSRGCAMKRNPGANTTARRVAFQEAPFNVVSKDQPLQQLEGERLARVHAQLVEDTLAMVANRMRAYRQVFANFAVRAADGEV